MDDKKDGALFGWIHISDIHFGHGDTGHGWDQKLVLGELRRDIKNLAVERRVDALFVTGDIGFSGGGRSPDEYKDARAWLLETGKAAGVGPDRIFLVPGNHDVNRSVDDRDAATGKLIEAVRSKKTPARSLDDALKNADERRLLAGRMEAYLELAQEFAPWAGRSVFPPAVERLFWVHAFDAGGGLRVRVVGLNTSLLCRDNDDKGQLLLGGEQIVAALADDPVPEELVVLLSHHPLRKGWLADEDRADTFLKNHAHVHLSGHVHGADAEEARSGAGGSFVRVTAGAAHGEQLPPWIPATHGYSFGEVRRGARGKALLRIHPRLWSPPRASFVIDVNGVLEGTSYSEHELRVTLPPAPHPLPSSGAVRVFLSWAPEDEAMKSALVKALAMLRRTGVVEISESRSGGEVPRGEVDPRLTQADIVLLLLSTDYLSSDYCFEVEMEAARERRQAGEAVVVAVLLREMELSTDADYKRLKSGERPEFWFEKLVRLPYASGRDQNKNPTGRTRSGIPVATWARADDAWKEVALEIRELIEERRKKT